MSSPWEPLLYAFAGLVLAMIIVITFPVCCRISRKEGFQILTTKIIPCPKNTRSFTNMAGDTMCCKGQVEGNFCDGNVICTMSGNSSKDVPTCKKLRDDNLAKIQTKCPTSVNWKSYYDDDEKGIKGCAANTNPERTAPLTPATSFCQIYDTKTDNKYYPNSCENFQKNFKFNTVFMNSARPNFCMDVDSLDLSSNKQWNNFFSGKPYTPVGMAPCNGSDSQAFHIDEKNRVRNKKGGILVYGNLFVNIIDPKLVDLILNKPPIPPKDLVGEEKDLVYDASSSLTKVPTANGGFSIGYGIMDIKRGQYIDDNTNFSDMWIVPVSTDNITKGAGEWSNVPLASVQKLAVPSVASAAPRGYQWKCNIVPV